MGLKDEDGMANNVDPDQEQYDRGQHCFPTLPRPVCLKTYDQYSNFQDGTISSQNFVQFTFYSFIGFSQANLKVSQK